MAKDRFSSQKRSVYDKVFRYGNDVIKPKVKRNNTLSSNHKLRIEKILRTAPLLESLNSWEKDFLVQMRYSDSYSDIQKVHLEKILKKVKK